VTKILLGNIIMTVSGNVRESHLLGNVLLGIIFSGKVTFWETTINCTSMAGTAGPLHSNSGASAYNENAKLFICYSTCTPVGLTDHRTPGP